MPKRKTTFGEFVAGLSGVALIVSLFFEWYAQAVGPVETSVSAWESLTVIDIVVAVIGTLPVAHWLARRNGWLDHRPLPIAPATLVAFAGLIAVVLVIVRMIDIPNAAAAADLGGRRVGAFLALVAGAGVVIGAVATLGERGQDWRGRSRPLRGPVANRPGDPVVRQGDGGPHQP